jgi:diguanylate cyclase (GGDEF)-like protein/PAS domain S-box-containing protein
MSLLQTDTGVRAVKWRKLAHKATLPLLGLALVALAVEAALVLLEPGSRDVMVRNCLVTGVVFVAAIATLLAGISRPGGTRAPWLALGLGIFSYACAFLVFFFFQKTLTKFPSTPDFFWLAFYPFVIATIALLARGQRRSEQLGISLDAAILALAIAALGYELIFNGLINVSQASDLVGGQLSYSVLDFAVLVMLVLVCAPSRAKVGKAYIALGTGMLIILISDILVVKEISDGTYAPGTLLDAGWPAGMLVLAIASRLGTSLERVTALRGRALYAAITISFCTAFGLLVEEGLLDRNPVVLALTGLVLCLILIRLIASVRENDRLARDNEGIISAAGEGILRTDRKGRLTYANPAALEMLGYSLAEVVGHRAHALIHHTRPNGGPYPASECPTGKSLVEGASQRVTDELFWRKDGSGLAVDYTSAPLREGGRIVGAVIVFDDVTHQRQMREQLRRQADHDPLTGLYNRRRFEEEVSGQLSYAKRYSRPGAVLMIDLDSFKFVNDSYGHPIGDRLLCDVGAILSATVGETDVVARIGGDEFAVLLREAKETEGVEVAKQLIAATRAESEPTVGASIGIARFDDSSERTPDELLIAADVALYEAKEAGGGTAVVHTGQRGIALTWIERIRSALDEGGLSVYAQPIADLETGQVAREELLVRMDDSYGDKIPPDSFLPAAERFGLINEIDLFVLAKGIGLVRRGTSIAANVSARTLTDPRYLAALERALETGLKPSCFNFEITETAAVANMGDAQEFARRVRELGCSLALDDFGTGFSSFTYLKHVPAQHLKIDSEFIRELERNPADQQLVRAIVSIARGLGQKTVAEGVENANTLEMVRELGVDYAQGFYIGRPAPTSGARATRSVEASSKVAQGWEAVR